MTPIRLHIVASGRVQGVGYRYFCQDAAVSSRITGWARNLPDGTVHIEAQGNQQEMADFCRQLAAGPATARVRDLQRREIPIHPDEDGFRILF